MKNPFTPIMRTFLFCLMLGFTTVPLAANSTDPGDPDSYVHKEVLQLFRANMTSFPSASSHEVNVGFMINAKNEIIVLDVQGENAAACAYVKKVLNYRKIKMRQSNLLTPYQIKIKITGQDI